MVKNSKKDLNTINKEFDQSNRDLVILNTIIKSVHRSLNADEVYKIALDMSLDLEMVDMCCIYLVNETKSEAILKYQRNFPDNYIKKASIIPSSNGLTWKVINSGKMVNINDAQEDSNIGPAGRMLGHHGLLGIPLTFEKEIIGVIWFLSYERRKFNIKEVELLSSLSTHVSLAIGKTTLHRDLYKKNKYLEISNKISESVYKSLDIEEVYKTAVDETIAIDNVDIVGIYLVDHKTDEAVLVNHRNFPKEYLRKATRIAKGVGITWRVIETGKVHYIENVQNDPDLGPAGKKMGWHCVLGIPLIINRRVEGVIWFISYEVQKYDDDQIKLFNSIANQLSLSISKAKLYEDFAKKSRYENIISSITKSVHQSIDLKDVLEYAVDSINKNIECVKHVTIYLVEGDEAVMQSHRGFTKEYLKRASRIPKPKGLIWKTLLDKKTLIVLDTKKDTVIGPAGRKMGIKSYISIPLFKDNNPLGVLALTSSEVDAFSEDDLKMAEMVAQQIQTAVDNANKVIQLSIKNRYESIISSIVQSVHKSMDLEEVLENAVDSLKKNIDPTEHVSIYMIENDHAVMKSFRGYEENHDFISVVSAIPKPKGFTWKAILEKNTINCSDIDEDDSIGPAGRKTGSKSYACVPLKVDNEIVGTINLHSRKKNAFNDDDIKLLEDVSHQISVAIKNTRQKEALSQSEQRYRTLYNQLPLGVYIYDSDLIIRHCNETMGMIMQTPMKKLIGLNMNKLMNKELVEYMLKALKGETCQYEGFYNIANNNVKSWLSTSVAPLKDSNENVISAMAVVEDRSEINRANEELTKVERLESLGVLAGGIAHDFNNILSGVLGCISLAKSYPDVPLNIIHELQEAETASFRARDLIQQLLAFAKGGTPVIKFIDIAKVVQESSSFALTGSSIKLVFEIPKDVWIVEADEIQISQVFNNLLINSKHAMSKGGIIKIGIENVENPHPKINGKFVRIYVRDEGTGISTDHLSQIFDPYFSTKQNEGTGLGLSISHSIIENHGGLITVESEMDQGTTFYIYLPASKLNQEIQVTEKDNELVTGSGRILIMDDEITVRKTAFRMLKRLGFEAEYSQHGTEALHMYTKAKELSKPYNAVILDLTVQGGIGGEETIKMLKKIDPDVKAIVSSGYSKNSVLKDYKKYGFSGILSKPYSIKELSDVLSKVI